MDHQEAAGAPVGAVVGVRKAGVDGEVVAGVRIHQAGGDGVEALRRLPVALLDLRAEFAGPAADREGLEQCEVAVAVFLPDLKFRFFLEDPHQDGGFLGHILLLDVGEHSIGDRLHVATVESWRAISIATGKRNGRRNRCGRQERAHKSRRFKTRTPPTKWLPQAHSPPGYPSLSGPTISADNDSQDVNPALAV